MRLMLAVVMAVLVTGCVPHFEKVGASPMIGRVVHDGTAAGVPDVMIWVTYTMPGGVFSAPATRAFGPYYTDADGFFRVPAHPFYMFQTFTIFDGDPAPTIMCIHPTQGVIGAMVEREPSSPIIRWRAPRSRDVQISFRMIDELPPEAREIAWRHVRVPVPRDWRR